MIKSWAYIYSYLLLNAMVIKHKILKIWLIEQLNRISVITDRKVLVILLASLIKSRVMKCCAAGKLTIQSSPFKISVSKIKIRGPRLREMLGILVEINHIWKENRNLQHFRRDYISSQSANLRLTAGKTEKIRI